MQIDELNDQMMSVSSGDYKKLMRLMIECLRVIPFGIPEVGNSAIVIAKKFWVEEITHSEELEQSRIKCWDYLDSHSASTNFEEPKFCAIRAIICVLYPEFSSDDIYELIDFFNEMLHSVWAKSSEDRFFSEILLIIKNFS